VLAFAVAGCGSPSTKEAGAPLARTAPGVGVGAKFRPPSLWRRAARGLPIDGLHCRSIDTPRYGVHLELFAARHVVLIPPGIGIAPPRERSGAYVRGGRCSYPLRTREPTGVIEVAGSGATLGDFLAVWGQPLASHVRAYVNGRRFRGNPRAIRLTRHAQIVLEVGGYVPPHARYRFPPGL
jgi:hypothetical protein